MISLCLIISMFSIMRKGAFCTAANIKIIIEQGGASISMSLSAIDTFLDR